MKKILLLLCTIFTIATANAEGAYYNLPDGAFATSVTATGYLAPNVYMPYSSTAYTWASTTGAGTWTVGETTVATDKETYNASYKIGYYSNMPMLTVGEATYQYGSGYAGSNTAKRVYGGSANMTYLSPALLFNNINEPASSPQYSVISSYKSTAYDRFGEYFNNTDVMYIDEILIPITANAKESTLETLFPTDDAHMKVTIYPATITNNGDGTYKKSADFENPIFSQVATKANVGTVSSVGAAVVTVKPETPLSINGAFLIEVTEVKNSGCYLYLRSDKCVKNNFSYYYNDTKNTFAYAATSTYGANFAFTVHAMFPALYKDDATVDTVNVDVEGGKQTFAIHANLDPKDGISMPEWITVDTISYNNATFSASKTIEVTFNVEPTTETREGVITINNRGKEITYTIKQEVAAAEPVATMTSVVGVERSITAGLNAAGTIGVDWGDGTIVEQTTTQAYDGWDGSVTFTGTPAGEGIIKVYAEGLTYLYANGKYNDEKTDIPNAITSIDVTKATDIEELLLNVNKIESIDLSKNEKLATLDLSNNVIASIDVTANVNLTSFKITGNKLSEIDLSKNEKLTTLYINQNNFTAVDFSGNPNLKSIYGQDNAITEVKLGTNKAKSHTINFVNNKLASFDVSGLENPTGSYVYLRDNLLAGDAVVIPTTVKRLWLDGNLFTLADLYAYKAKASQTLTYATTFAGEYAQAPMQIAETVNAGETIDLSSQAMLGETATVFTWTKADGTVLVEGTDYTVENGVFTFLTTNDSIRCSMTNAELPNFTETVPFVTTWTSVIGKTPVIVATSAVGVERSITAGLNAAGTIGVDWGDGTIVEQTTTQAYDGWDGSVTFTGTPAGEGVIKVYAEGLTYLYANGKYNDEKTDIPNAITSIDVTKATDLEELLLNVNKIESIDLSKNEKLATLDLSNNVIASIDVTANVNLTSFKITGNKLSEIDLSKNEKLTTLYINQNNFTAVDFSGNPNLKSIYGQDNAITEVKLGTNKAKNHTINFVNNKLASFDVSGLENPTGSYVYLRDNLLAGDAVVIPTTVKRLWLDGNLFTLADLYAYKAKASQTLTYATTFAGEYAQAPMQIAETVNAGETIDLSSQAMLGETATVFTWTKADGTALVEGTDYTVENGVFTFITTNDSIRCMMTNAELPNFTETVPFVTTWTSVQTTTGINNIFNAIAGEPTYNLQGVRVNNNFNGIVIRNGKKFINK